MQLLIYITVVTEFHRSLNPELGQVTERTVQNCIVFLLIKNNLNHKNN